ncbi:cupin domain-containing protein [Paenibacillus sp. CF384]|uniref:cupin domain-containing protein n=1 Tax=Paenibacillus sp. CF384 TaxID=1884382 RepID=UPI00089C351E|nr:cupin domain-containing protein [Paenibacillus sp. CF384]SDW89188.1 Cupin domain-containing protein [Paenibacillus sp. CF384]
MPVNFKSATQVFPEWSELSHYGINHLKVGDVVQLHYHDANEYWIIISGRGNCTTEGDAYEIGPGDMVLTKRGDEHSLVVTEDMVAVYIYGIMPEGGRVGYLFRDRGDAQ